MSGGRRWAGRVGGISTRFVSNEACNRPYRHRTSRHRQAAYRPRDVAKQRVPARTSDQSERQARGGFRVFAQVSGLGCIDLGDRRSRVQISAARQINHRWSRISGGRHSGALSLMSRAPCHIYAGWRPDGPRRLLPGRAEADQATGELHLTDPQIGPVKTGNRWPEQLAPADLRSCFRRSRCTEDRVGR